jgi:hypothetical protein
MSESQPCIFGGECEARKAGGNCKRFNRNVAPLLRAGGMPFPDYELADHCQMWELFRFAKRLVRVESLIHDALRESERRAARKDKVTSG